MLTLNAIPAYALYEMECESWNFQYSVFNVGTRFRAYDLEFFIAIFFFSPPLS